MTDPDKDEQPELSIDSVSRRSFVRSASLVTAAGLVPAAWHRAWGGATPDTVSSIFTLGVGSGDPGPNSIVLWTRLAPEPLDGGGMGRGLYEVRWRIATDPGMRRIVREGAVIALPEKGHAISVEATGLEPDRWYFYQFSFRGARSRIGRTRTFPHSGARPERLRFALASCQHYESGYYAAYRDMLGKDLDFVLHVGDYIYEYGADAKVPAERRHTGGEIASLEDYRNRYALYRLDPNLQNAHAAFPFIVTFDDHEVDNNYAGLVPEDDQSAEAFRVRRRNAYRVYRESMPLSRRVRLRADELSLYRRLRFGKLAQFLVLDSRQYRTDQPCQDGLQVLQACPAILNPDATLLGAEQESWMFGELERSPSTWNVLAQQVMMMRWDLGVLTGQPVNFFNVDAWDGYQVARSRIMKFLRDKAIANPVVLTGDIHSAWAADLKLDFVDPNSPTVGAEFVCTSVTSTFGDANHAAVAQTLPSNPHIKFFDGLHRGYAICTVTPDSWRTDFRAVARAADSIFTVPSADLPVSDLASYALKAGQPGLIKLL